jgi:hypothetical protein
MATLETAVARSSLIKHNMGQILCPIYSPPENNFMSITSFSKLPKSLDYTPLSLVLIIHPHQNLPIDCDAILHTSLSYVL